MSKTNQNVEIGRAELQVAEDGANKGLFGSRGSPSRTVSKRGRFTVKTWSRPSPEKVTRRNSGSDKTEPQKLSSFRQNPLKHLKNIVTGRSRSPPNKDMEENVSQNMKKTSSIDTLSSKDSEASASSKSVGEEEKLAKFNNGHPEEEIFPNNDSVVQVRVDSPTHDKGSVDVDQTDMVKESEQSLSREQSPTSDNDSLSASPQERKSVLKRVSGNGSSSKIKKQVTIEDKPILVKPDYDTEDSETREERHVIYGPFVSEAYSEEDLVADEGEGAVREMVDGVENQKNSNESPEDRFVLCTIVCLPGMLSKKV